MQLPTTISSTILKSNTGLAKSAVIQTSKKWPTVYNDTKNTIIVGSTIKIKFLNGSLLLQRKVKQFAAQWLTYANVTFKYVAATDNADVKISFESRGASSSFIGTDCKGIAQTLASTHLVGLTDLSTDADIKALVLHEFGHVLGLVHEYQSPVNHISWNKPAVYAYYAELQIIGVQLLWTLIYSLNTVQLKQIILHLIQNQLWNIRLMRV